MKFCKLADITDWQDPEFQTISSLLDLDRFQGRKAWEYIQVYKGLQQLGLLNDHSRGLGLGSGKEGLIYALTNVCGEITATDLYNSANWQTAAMSVNAVYEENPFPYRRERLVVRNMDMTQLEFPDNSFDFIWSCCAIEHVNSFQDLHKVYKEIHRVLKPGGIAALTTEYNLSDHHSYEPNMLFTDRFWIENWFTGTDPLIQGFELVDPPDLTLTPAPRNTPQSRSISPRTAVPVYSRNMVIDSVAFFLRKTGSFDRTYSDQWLPQDLRIYWQGCNQLQAKEFAGAEAIFQSLFQTTTDPKLKVAVVRRLLVALQAQGKRKEAIDYCQKVMPYCTRDADTDHLLPIATQCRKYKLWQEAQHLYQQVIDCPGARDVQVVRSYLGRAEYCDLQKRPYEALKFAEQACQALPNVRDVAEIAHAHYHRGLYLEKVGYLRAATQAYQVAIDASAPSTKVHQNSTIQLQACQKMLEEQPLRQQMKWWAGKLGLATVLAKYRKT